ncbi:MAG TPA: hypothetical protein VGA64_07290, partial [Candidatus Polarisedimenticolia bacterium]
RFHDCRATYATLQIAAGVNPLTVMKNAGWKSLAMVMQYASLTGDGDSEAMAASEPIFGASPQQIPQHGSADVPEARKH